MKFSSLVLSSLLALTVAQQDNQGWGFEIFNGVNLNSPSSFGDFFDQLGKEIMVSLGGGPSFLRNVSRQARQDYYKIYQNKTLTRAQLTSAVNTWSATNNVTSLVSAYNAQKQSEKSQFRSNVTAAVQQLPSLISQLNAIDDNQSLTPTQAEQQTRQTIRNATLPFLRDLVLDVQPSRSVFGSSFHDDVDSGESADSEENAVAGY